MSDRPKPETLDNGTKIVYPLWRDDLAEAIVMQAETEEQIKARLLAASRNMKPRSDGTWR